MGIYPCKKEEEEEEEEEKGDNNRTGKEEEEGGGNPFSLSRLPFCSPAIRPRYPPGRDIDQTLSIGRGPSFYSFIYMSQDDVSVSLSISTLRYRWQKGLGCFLATPVPPILFPIGLKIHGAFSPFPLFLLLPLPKPC